MPRKKHPPMFTIYRVLNKINGKCYIGQTVQMPRVRWLQHLNKAKHTKRGSVSLIANSIAKHGEENFLFEILCSCPDLDALNASETFFIYITGSSKRSLGYNVDLVPNNTGPRNPETVEKIAAKLRGRKIDPDIARKRGEARRGMKMGPRPQEVKDKISKKNTGKKRTPEQLKKQSERQTGKKGHPQTEETRKKIGLIQLGRKHTPEHKAKIGAKSKGRKHKQESKDKIAEANRNREYAKASEETKKKMRESHMRDGWRYGDEFTQEMKDNMTVTQIKSRQKYINKKDLAKENPQVSPGVEPSI